MKQQALALVTGRMRRAVRADRDPARAARDAMAGDGVYRDDRYVLATDAGLVVWVGTDVEPVLCIPWREVADAVMPTPVHAIALF